MSLAGRLALVTGGTGGIGTAICQQLHDQGARVVAGYNRGGCSDYADTWKAQCQEEGYKLEVCYGDVSSFESSQAMIEQIQDEYGCIDVLINCAGITQDGTLKKMDQLQWHSVLRINLDSVFNVTRHIIEGMIERKFGRIVNISSINGQKGQFGQTNYSAAKAGIHGFTMALAQEVASKGITVNTVSPGYVGTEMVKKIDAKIVDQIVSQIPVGRLAYPEEIARMIGFLADEEQAFITGANIAINGGQYMT